MVAKSSVGHLLSWQHGACIYLHDDLLDGIHSAVYTFTKQPRCRNSNHFKFEILKDNLDRFSGEKVTRHRKDPDSTCVDSA